MTRFQLVAASVLAGVFVSPAAFASGDQASVDLCAAALEAEIGNAEAINFKSIRGVSAKTITFEVETADGLQTVDCKVKRGEVTALDGLADLPAYAS